jgi:hypothetical protein
MDLLHVRIEEEYVDVWMQQAHADVKTLMNNTHTEACYVYFNFNITHTNIKIQF